MSGKIAAKRYTFFRKKSGGRLEIIDPSEHGLGHLLDPLTNEDNPNEWIDRVWQYIVATALGLLFVHDLDVDTLAIRLLASYGYYSRGSAQIIPEPTVDKLPSLDAASPERTQSVKILRSYVEFLESAVNVKD